MNSSHVFVVGTLSMLLACGMSLAQAQGQTVPTDFMLIGFEQPSPQPPHTSFALERYREYRYLLEPTVDPIVPGALTRTGANTVGRPDNGTSHISVTSSATLTRFDGNLFDFYSVDLAEYSTFFDDPLDITIVGTYADDSTTSVTFSLDGVIDGTGPLTDFETFLLPSTFHDLSSVEFLVPGDPYAFDNVVVTVPEPSTFVLTAIIGSTIAVHIGRRRMYRASK